MLRPTDAIRAPHARPSHLRARALAWPFMAVAIVMAGCGETSAVPPLDGGVALNPPPPPGSVQTPVGSPAPLPCVAGSATCTPTIPPPPAPPAIPVAPACALETDTVLLFENRIIESITSRGRLFNFEADGSPWPTNGMDLGQVAYYAAGPCAGRAPGTCRFDTRSFALFPGNHLVELVTAYGRTWAWENGVVTDPGTDLAAVPRYAEICALRGGPTVPCTFETRTFVHVDGELFESITAYGKYFAFDQHGSRSKDNGLDLAIVPRYGAGPCKGQGPHCIFSTRTYGLLNGSTVEIVTANGFVWRYLANEQAGFPEVPPSGVPITSVPAWASLCHQ